MGLSRQGAVVLLRVPHPQTAASRRAVQPTELPVAFASAPALPEHALCPVRVPDSRGAPASGASLAGVQEPSGQGVVWVAQVHVIQRHVHPDVLPCHHELPLETAPLFLLRLRLPLPLLLLPRQPASLHASPLRRCSLRPAAAQAPPRRAPARRAPARATAARSLRTRIRPRSWPTARTAARRGLASAAAAAAAVAAPGRLVAGALLLRHLSPEPCEAQPVSTFPLVPHAHQVGRICVQKFRDPLRQTLLLEVVVAGAPSPIRERVRPDTVTVTEVLESAQDLSALLHGALAVAEYARGVLLERCEQALLVQVLPARHGAVPRQAHAGALLPRRARHRGHRVRPLLEELPPDGPGGDCVRLHVREILRRPTRGQRSVLPVRHVAVALELLQARGQGVAHASDAAARAAPGPQHPELRGHVARLARVEAAPPWRDLLGGEARGKPLASRQNEIRLHGLGEPHAAASPRSLDPEDARKRPQPAPVRPRALVPGLQSGALAGQQVLHAAVLAEAIFLKLLSELAELVFPLRRATGRQRALPGAVPLIFHRLARVRQAGHLRLELQPLPPRSDLLVRQHIAPAPHAHEILLALVAEEVGRQGQQHAAVHRGARSPVRPRRLRVARLARGLAHLRSPPDLAPRGAQRRQQRR